MLQELEIAILCCVYNYYKKGVLIARYARWLRCMLLYASAKQYRRVFHAPAVLVQHLVACVTFIFSYSIVHMCDSVTNNSHLSRG